jgi:type IV pilus assembly protein PilB
VPIEANVLGAASDLNWVPLGRLLVDAGLLTTDQLEQALAVKETTGKRLGEIFVELGFTSEEVIAGALAQQYELEFVDLDLVTPDPEAVAQLPEALAQRYQAIPVRLLSDGVLLLAVADPTNVAAADDLRLALGSSFRLAVAVRGQIERALARTHRPSLQLLAEPERPSSAAEPQLPDTRDLSSSEPTINLVNSLLSSAFEQGASDIHFEPGSREMAVRVRVDGVVRDLATVPAHAQPAVAGRLKALARLDLADRRTPQEGRVSTSFGGDPIDLRIVSLPSTHGEHVALRILTRNERPPQIADLGMSPAAAEAFTTALEQPYGTVVVCGPSGSGKSTTLYGALAHLQGPTRTLMTIEDPIEHRLDGVTQVQVDVGAGLTFATGLRTILRSDPDVVLVGELRDEETASTAMTAGTTGHVVLTTLHAHNAAGAIARLRDLGVEPSLVAASLNCVVAQQLARRLCTDCRTPAEPTADGQLYRAVGCSSCHGTGYRGRVALREVLPVQGEIRALVERSAEEIFAAAVRHGMTTLRDDGMRLALNGVTSVDEIRRVTGLRLS